MLCSRSKDKTAVGWHTAAKSSDLADNSILGVQINGIRIALYRIEGAVYATNDICSHDLAFLSDGYLDGDCVECPLHQALFHIPTGEVRAPPACEPIPIYPAKEEAGNVLVELPE
jgi:nitrite reductase/ring-hydroxylating ferredoxin subunit